MKAIREFTLLPTPTFLSLFPRHFQLFPNLTALCSLPHSSHRPILSFSLRSVSFKSGIATVQWWGYCSYQNGMPARFNFSPHWHVGYHPVWWLHPWQIDKSKTERESRSNPMWPRVQGEWSHLFMCFWRYCMLDTYIMFIWQFSL